jgi:hypothetical protein
MIINQDGPDQYSIPKIDAHEAGTVGAVRAGVGRVRHNKYRGRCIHCNEWVAPDAGLLTMVPGPRFKVMHKSGDCNKQA